MLAGASARCCICCTSNEDNLQGNLPARRGLFDGRADVCVRPTKLGGDDFYELYEN